MKGVRTRVMKKAYEVPSVEWLKINSREDILDGSDVNIDVDPLYNQDIENLLN